MENLQLEISKMLKSNGTLFLVMGIICYALYTKLEAVEEKYEVKMNRIMDQVSDCNKQQVLLLKEQIDKNNRLLEIYEANRNRGQTP